MHYLFLKITNCMEVYSCIISLPLNEEYTNTWDSDSGVLFYNIFMCKSIEVDYKTNTQIAKELKITPILDKLLEYKRKWIKHVNRMPCNRLPRVMKHYSLTGRRNHGRPLKRLWDTWDRNGSTSGPTPW